MRPEWQYLTGPGGAVLPVAEIEGRRPGPTWLLTAGVHGDEYEGPEAIRRAVATLAEVDFAGRVIALPVTNPMAYSAGTRLTPADGGNLNRSFPGHDAGTPTARWAAWLWRSFMVRADRLIDLHAGGVTWQFEPLVGYYDLDDAHLATYFRFSQWHMPDTPGVLSREFRLARGPALGVELGSGGTCNEELVKEAEGAIIASVLQALNNSEPYPVPVFRHHDLQATKCGEWRADCDCGQSIAEGEMIGSIRSWTGDVVQTLSSPMAGRLLAVRRLVSVQAGDLVAVVGFTT